MCVASAIIAITMMTMHDGGSGGGESKNVFVYTLPLEDKCWYVGTSKQPHARLKQHRSGIGPEWTKLHPPIKGFQGLKPYNDEQEARLQEDVQVKRLMLEHGTDFVRGGSYSGVHLSQMDLQTLNKELFHATNRCMRCGGEGHWAKDCAAAVRLSGFSSDAKENSGEVEPIIRVFQDIETGDIEKVTDDGGGEGCSVKKNSATAFAKQASSLSSSAVMAG